MAKLRHRRASRRKPRCEEARGDVERTFLLDYYQRAFVLFHAELERQGYNPTIPHPVRRRFWQLLPERHYSSLESRPLMQSYVAAVEDELESVISKHSLAYWLHVYRRLSPGPIGANQTPETIAETRGTMEAAIQKYATPEPCSGVGLSHEIPVNRVLGGLLMGADFEHERSWIQEKDQLVLTDFTPAALRDVYDAERLAFELWRGSAMLRSIGKGGELVVNRDDACVADIRTPELDTLIKSYDARNSGWDPTLLSALGVVFDIEAIREQSLVVFLPAYNVCRVPGSECAAVISHLLNVSFPTDWVPNFLWVPYLISAYRDAHLPLAEAFRTKHGVSLDAALAIICALGMRLLEIWTTEHPAFLVHYWQRAYEGPCQREVVYGAVRSYAAHAWRLFGRDDTDLDPAELEAALQYWSLDGNTRADIDLLQAGPHAVFLPFGPDRVFVDYAWIIPRLYRLFLGVSVPDQNFKGEALENLVRGPRSVLPARPCKSLTGEYKQIDAAFAVGDRLVIVECRAAGKSIGFSRGDPDALRHRNRILASALSDVDRKAVWLAENPRGTNYDITQFQAIIPIAVTPFVEFIPSLRPYYWLTDRLPRVLTPTELGSALRADAFAGIVNNTVPIRQSPGCTE